MINLTSTSKAGFTYQDFARNNIFSGNQTGFKQNLNFNLKVPAFPHTKITSSCHFGHLWRGTASFTQC